VIALPINTIVVPFAKYAGLPVVEGLIQRVEISMGWVWLALTALHMWRKARKARSEEASTRIAGTSVTAD
jgi:hypothetical protein